MATLMKIRLLVFVHWNDSGQSADLSVLVYDPNMQLFRKIEATYAVMEYIRHPCNRCHLDPNNLLNLVICSNFNSL